MSNHSTIDSPRETPASLLGKLSSSWLANPLVWMVAVGLALRVAMILYLRSYELMAGPNWLLSTEFSVPGVLRHFPFRFGYETGAVAYSLATGHGFSSPFAGSTGPTSWLPPLYPLLCALVFKMFGCFTQTSGFVILSINSLFGALTCLPICRIGELTVGRKVGLWSGWIWAGGVVFMRWPTTWVWDTALSALLLSVLFLQSLKLASDTNWKAWARFGLLWGITALTNPALLAFLPPAGLYPAYWLGRSRRAWLRQAVISALVFSVCIAPWIIRNRVVFGKWIFIRGNAPFEFTMGNYHLSNAVGWPGKHPTQNKWEYAKYERLGEVAYMEEKKKEGSAFLRKYPGEFLSLCGRRFVAFWTGSNLFSNAWPRWFDWPFTALMLLGLIVALAYRVQGAWLYFWLMTTYPLTYYVFVVHNRFRHAIEPEMLLLSTYFVSSAIRDVGSRFFPRLAAAGENSDTLEANYASSQHG